MIKCEKFIRIMKEEQTSIDLQINTITATSIERNRKCWLLLLKLYFCLVTKTSLLEDIGNLQIQIIHGILSPCCSFEWTVVMKY